MGNRSNRAHVGAPRFGRLVLAAFVGVIVLSSVVKAADAPSSLDVQPATASPATSDRSPDASALELLVLGSGGPGATGRAASSFLILVDGRARILVDAGPGSFVRLGESGVALTDLDVILLTHLHADHAGELPGIVKARAVASRARAELRVFGPTGRSPGGNGARFPSTSRFISLLFGPDGAFSYLPNFAAQVTFRTTDIPVVRAAGASPNAKVLLDEDGLRILAVAGHHRDAPAVIYRVEHAGRSITFSGDIDSQAHAALRTIARDTDLLVVNSVVLDPPGSPPVLYQLHTAPHDIGTIAADAHARRLLLAHISPAVESHSDEVLEAVRAEYSAPVEFAKDGKRIAP